MDIYQDQTDRIINKTQAEDADTLTPSQAYAIASQWGSYMHNGDPGAVFYSFSDGRALVEDEDHRADLISHTRECIAHLDDAVEPDPSDLPDLMALLAYFQQAPVHNPNETRWYSSFDGSIQIQMTREQADSMYHSGDCGEDVEAALRMPWLAPQLEDLDDSDVQRELRDWGFDPDDLEDEQRNRERLVWMAAGYIKDSWL